MTTDTQGSTTLTGTTAAGGQSSAEGGNTTDAGAATTTAATAATGAATDGSASTSTAATTDADGKPPADGKGDTAVEYKFELPEGMALDAKASEQFTEIAKDLKLPQDAAQKLVSLYASQLQAQQEVHAETVKGWAETVKTDKELGGDHLPATMAAAQKVMATFATPALKDYLDTTGLGNHPELVRFVAKISKALSEDTFVRGGNTTVKGDPAQAMYPNSKMN
jgi:hypothetical protein